MNEVINSILSSKKTIASNGEIVNAASYISREQGEAIFRLIRDNKTILRTLEIGCANGLSSLYICEALRGRPDSIHTIVDPFQNTDWKGTGITALERAGLSHFELVEEESELVLPSLLRNGDAFDLIFIDGWHTFDHALVDFFYSNRLLKIGGFLILDDANMPPIGKLVAYIRNYDCYKLSEEIYVFPENFWLRFLCQVFRYVPATPNVRYFLPSWGRALIRRARMVVFKKISGDKRKWNWYQAF
jgi:predicted O-methyltransferase YrrM